MTPSASIPEPARRAAVAAAHQVLADAEARRRAELTTAFPLLVIEATPGAGATTLLREWSDESEPPELRLFLSAENTEASGEQILAAVTRAVIRQVAGGRVGPLPDDAGLAPALTRLRRPLAVAITRADYLHAEDFRALLVPMAARDTAQLIVSGLDLHQLMDEARRLRIPFRRVSDEDLALTAAEIAAQLTLIDVDHSPATVARIVRRTLGLASAVRVAIDRIVDREEGVIYDETASISPGEIGGYLFTRGVQHWPSPLPAFIGTMAHIPRFTMSEANAISQITSARSYVDRMCALRLGRITFHPALRQQVFTWFESARATTLGYLQRSETDETERERLRRTVSAAQDSFDTELYLASLIALGRFDEAEQYLADWLWDCLPNGYSPVWAAMESFGPLEFRSYPRLVALRIRVEPRHRGAASKRALVQAAELVSGAASTAGDPDLLRRLGLLALGVEFARVTRQAAQIADLLDRVRELIAVLMSGAHLATVSRGRYPICCSSPTPPSGWAISRLPRNSPDTRWISLMPGRAGWIRGGSVAPMRLGSCWPRTGNAV